MALAAAENRLLEPLVAGIEKMSERGFEPAGDLCLLRLQRNVRRDYTDNRRDHISADGPVLVQRADHLHNRGIERHLFEALAQGCVDRSFPRICATARERDLPRVGPHSFMPFREDYAGPRSVGDCDQDGSWNFSLRAQLWKISGERRLLSRRAECGSKSFGKAELHERVYACIFAGMTEKRTAIVTGGGKRIGEHLVHVLLDQGWTVVAHVRHEEDEVAPGAVKAVAELSRIDCADRIFAVCVKLPPIRLLVNNAARFAWDDLEDFDAGEFDSHMHVNVRAPVLLTQGLAARHTGGPALIVNILDSKLAAPNADFLSYTLSKQALAGFTEIAARALAPRGIRVNAIAPALMLKSPGQSEENFRSMHDRNPLGSGVDPAHLVPALDFLIASPTVTGEVIVIDGGQRFQPPHRDVQFLE